MNFAHFFAIALRMICTFGSRSFKTNEKGGSALIKFSILEVAVAILVGAWRRLTSWSDGLRDRAGRGADFNADILGAMGEMAVAKHLNIYYEPTNRTFSAPDLGDMEIKTVSWGSWGHRNKQFPVEISTPDERKVVCVVGSVESRQFDVVGSIEAAKAKAIKPTTVRYRPAHWVPFSSLSKIGGSNNDL